MGIRIIRGAVVIMTGLAFASTASAASIGVNFTGGGNGSSPAISMLPGDTAGVVPQANFNNEAGSSGTGVTGLMDSTGAVVTGLSLTYTGGGTYSSIGGATIAPADGNEKLNTGFIFGNGTVTLTGIPYPTYNLYIYELNDAAGRVETTNLTVPAANQGSFFGSAATPNDTSHVDQSASTPYVYTQTTSTVAGSPTANGDYVLFAGLSGSSLSFNVSAPGNGYLNGFQIVSPGTPEPASVGLLGVAGLALLARRRTTV